MIRGFLAALLVLCVCPAVVPAATPQEVDAAVKRAVDWLYSKQKDGTWETAPARDASGKGHDIKGGQWGGETALAVYALLAAGESPQDQRLAEAINFLKKADLIGVYALALRAQVYQLLPSTPELKGLMSKDATVLRAMLKTKGEASGFYDYTDTPGRSYSHSRGNYGVLGMWALEQAGVEVPVEFWRIVEKGWISHQDASGGWTYQLKSSHPLTPGMTAAGVATLFITQDYVNPGRGLNCIPSPQSPAIDKGLAWLVENFSKVATDEDYDRDWPFPTLYAVERVGVASGLKYFGDINWYQHGADWLIKKQNKNGSFAERGRSGDVSDTAFALLFLARGRAPVVVNKLDYSAGAPEGVKIHWNMRPRDAARMVRWVGKSVERDLQWQIVTLAAPAEELSDAPILFLAGKDPWTPNDEGAAKIKQFIERGGLLLVNADCMGKGFVASMRKLGVDMFPGYEFRELPADHPIYTEQQFLRERWKTKPSILGLSNGVRELMLIIPQADPAKSWQAGIVGGREELWQLASNIILYAVDKRGLRNRGETHLVTRDDKQKRTKTISLARLEYAGNWDPEPGGWRRMADVMHNDGVELQVSFSKATELGDAKIVHITGTKPLTLDSAGQVALKRAMDTGGTIVIDAGGGSSEFAASVEKLLPLLATEPLKPIPPDHELYSAGGEKLADVKYRDYAARVVGAAKDPRLQGVERNGRWVILYSREDLSAGLVGQSVDGIIGYTPDSATALMKRILHYAADAKK
ncbi:MAG TPA: DUF4159 domain-containing protein [Tepidisphaeraceae bacterium]|nr:DUF4159 domain-containing protein [Tepidisphaeraceae bacterium]